MAFTVAELEALTDSTSVQNGIQRWSITGDNVTAKTVKAAVSSKQIVVLGGHMTASATTLVFLLSAAAGTEIAWMKFVGGGTMAIPFTATLAGELLEIDQDTNVTLKGVIYTIPILAGQRLPGMPW